MKDIREHFKEDFPARAAPRLAQQQMKLAVFMAQRPRIVSVLEKWGKIMHKVDSSDKNWTTAFCVLLVLTLIMDKTIAAASRKCEGKIKWDGLEAKAEREEIAALVRLMETEFFEKCKEIFHWKFKTRKGWNERFNPIRDHINAWRGKAVDEKTARFVEEMKKVVDDFGMCLHLARLDP
jgi:hypothetical protein